MRMPLHIIFTSKS